MRAWTRDIDPASKTEEVFYDNGDTLPARFNVDSRDIKEGKKIGQGIWTVHEAEWLGRNVAVKKFVAESTFRNVSSTSREVNRMLGLRHPNVLKLLGFYLTTQKEQVLECAMIMELMDCDLEDYIARGPLSDDQVVYIISQVARGMNHMHQKGCFHRDLKPKNVLLRKSIVTGFNVDVKIADFGSSELMGASDIDRTAGTTGYKAPEQFDCESKLFPDKADVFGFGALCFKILTGKKPYESRINLREVIKQIDRAPISQQNLPKNVVKMIWKCLDVNPELRPDFKEISRILDRALSAIQEKMPRPLPPSTSPSLPSKVSMSKEVQGHDQMESILHSMGLSKEYEAHFIPFEELSVIGLIGQGVIASIYKVKWKGIFYAQKIFHERDGLYSRSPNDDSYMGKNYFEPFPKLFHKNIVTFMGYSLTLDNRISIIMELQAMDLSIALGSHSFEGRKPSLDIQRWTIVREIAEGMKYLHDQGVVHGDLKPRNVVLSRLDTAKMVVKLIDFAYHPRHCTTQYAAPEILNNRRWGTTNDFDAKKSDVFSFGILCQEILGGAPLLRDYQPRKYIEAILMGKRPPIPIGTSLEMECLINGCWNGDPHGRPDFSEVCERLSRTVHYHSCQGHNYPKRFSQRCCFM